MDNRRDAITPTKSGSLGEKLGLYGNKTPPALLTSLTKPLSVSTPLLLPIYPGPSGETLATFTNPDTFTLTANKSPDLQGGREIKGQHNLLTANTSLDLQGGVDKQVEEIHGVVVEDTVQKEQLQQTFHTEHAVQSVKSVPLSSSSLETHRHDQVTAYLDSLEEHTLVHSIGSEKQRHKSDNCLKKNHIDLSLSNLYQNGTGTQCPLIESHVSAERSSIPGARTHTDSIGSSFSLDESVTGRSRCHACDVSSTGSSSRPHTVSNDSGFLDQIDAALGTYNSRNKLSQSRHFLDEEDIAKEVFGEVDSDVSCCKYPSVAKVVEGLQRGIGVVGTENKTKTVTLTKEQLIFILQRVELSRYKAILEERLADQAIQNKSQRQTLACLIQAVVILNKRLFSEKDRWRKLQFAIRQLQLEREVYMRRQAKMTVCMCAIFCLYLLNLKLVRNRLMSVISYFGIVETVKKINRTRKMIAENWRNIPSLLTNFWRLFIFRYSSRLNATIPGQSKLSSS